MLVNVDVFYQQCLGIKLQDRRRFCLDCDLSEKELSELQSKINRDRKKSRLDETVRLSREGENGRNIDAYCCIGEASEEIIYQECLEMEAGNQIVFSPDFDSNLISEKLPELFDRVKRGRKKPGTIVLFNDYNKIKAKCLLPEKK